MQAALNSAFKRISQGKGFITQDSLQYALRTLGGTSVAFLRAADSIEALMNQLDLDGSGKIEYEEFAGATMKVCSMSNHLFIASVPLQINV